MHKTDTPPYIVQDVARAILQSSQPEDKCKKAHALKSAWDKGTLVISNTPPAGLPCSPGRPDRPELVAPKDVKRRRPGSKAGRVALLHAIAHIEFNAINLAADMLARFSHSPRIAESARQDFVSDWIGVCDDEARHFQMISRRLEDLGSFYGALPAHNGLWEAAIDTAHDLAARLAIAPMVLEARGLDVTPGMIDRLKSAGDSESADILTIIYEEEIHHVAAGVRWFSHICRREDKSVKGRFKSLLQAHYKGTLKPPFNTKARTQAGLLQTYYSG